MSGKLLLMRNNDKQIFKTSFYYDFIPNSKHNHIYFKFNNGYVLIYNDVRRFGFLKLYKNINPSQISFLSKLGLEPLTKKFNPSYFKKFLKYLLLSICLIANNYYWD